MEDSEKSHSHSISRKRRKRNKSKTGLKWFQIKRAFFTFIDLSPTEILRHWRRYKNNKERIQSQSNNSDGQGGKKLSSDYEKVPNISAKMKEDRIAAMEELQRRRDHIAEEKLIKRGQKKRRSSRSSRSSSNESPRSHEEYEFEEKKRPKPFLAKSLLLTTVASITMVAIAFVYHSVLGFEWKPETDYGVFYKHTAAQNQGGQGAVGAITQIKTSAEWITAEDRFSFVIIHDIGKKIWMRKKNGDIIKHTSDSGWVSSSNIDGKIEWKPLSSNLQFLLDHVAFPIAPLSYIENSQGTVEFQQFSNTFDLLCYQLVHKWDDNETIYHAAYKRGLSILAERNIGATNIQLNFGNFRRVDAYEVPFSIHQKIHGQKALTIRIKSINFKTKWKNEEQKSNNT